MDELAVYRGALGPGDEHLCYRKEKLEIHLFCCLSVYAPMFPRTVEVASSNRPIEGALCHKGAFVGRGHVI